MLLGSANRLRGVSVSKGMRTARYFFNSPHILEEMDIDDPGINIGDISSSVCFVKGTYISWGDKSDEYYLLISDRSGTKWKSFLLPFRPQVGFSANGYYFVQDFPQNRIWRSNDAGKTLTNVATTIGTMGDMTYLNDVYVATILSAGTTQYGFYYSTNDGSSWTHASGGWSDGSFVRRVINDGTRFIATGQDGPSSGNSRIVTSTNGSTWSAVTTPGNEYNLTDIVFLNGLYFLRTSIPGNRDNDQIWVKNDISSGAWDLITHPFTNGRIDRLMRIGNTLYCFRIGTPFEVAFSNDDGDTWTELEGNISISSGASSSFDHRPIATKYDR